MYQEEKGIETNNITQPHDTDRSHTQKENKNELANDCKHQTTSANKVTNARPKGEEM